MFTPGLHIATPNVVVVDNFYANPDEVRAFALQLQYHEDKRYYRGNRSMSLHRFPGIKERFEDLLKLRITDWDEQPVNGVFQYCIGGDQRVFHSDMQKYAAVVYLTPDAPLSAGTQLLRSKETKLRAVNPRTAAEIGMTTQQAEILTYRNKLLDPTAWDVVDVIGNVYNRMVLWNAQLIHVAGDYFGTDVSNGRLFHIFFFNAE